MEPTTYNKSGRTDETSRTRNLQLFGTNQKNITLGHTCVGGNTNGSLAIGNITIKSCGCYRCCIDSDYFGTIDQHSTKIYLGY